MKFKEGWNNRILVVDDEENIHKDFDQTLKSNLTSTITDDMAKAFGSNEEKSFLPEFEIFHARSGEEAYNKIKQSLKDNNPIALTYMDMRMPPGWNGFDTIKKIREIDKNIEIVIVTAYTDIYLSEIVENVGLLDKLLYIRKPFSREEIQQMTISLVEKWNVTRESEINRQRLETVINSTSEAIAMVDLSGIILFANKIFLDMFGLNEKSINKLTTYDLQKYFKDHDKFRRDQDLFFSNPDMTFNRVVEIRIPNRMILSLYTAPIFSSERKAIGRIIVYRDVTKEIEIDQMKAELLRLREEVEVEYSFDKLKGNSKEMHKVFTLIDQASQSDITVLIQGETGTGKELIAKAIHYNSNRKNGPFVPVNCAAIPETLIESELFGHEKGSFTGATTRKIGRFEQANGGTILLDEIGEMQTSLQVRLLRVLQEREIQRIGGNISIPVDVRVIASTNANLEEAIKSGKFREDLFYRISAFPIVIPPLRERKEDIPLLAEFFLDRFSKRANKSVTVISSEAMELLMSHNWPGNVRELESAIERGVLLETLDILQADNLPPLLLANRKLNRTIISKKQEDIANDQIIPLEDIEKQTLIDALRLTNHNIQQTAKALGINRATVYRKMKKYGLVDKQ